MKVMHVGVPSDDQIMQLFGGSQKKKVFMHWKCKRQVTFLKTTCRKQQLLCTTFLQFNSKMTYNISASWPLLLSKTYPSASWIFAKMDFDLSGWRSSGIVSALNSVRNGELTLLNPHI